jgi:PAS domain-containing protein
VSQEKEIEALKRALEREKEARKQAERIMEEKSMELYLANQRLLQINESLENTILERTKEMNSLARFPEENPYPIFRFAGPEKSLLYSNKAGKRIIDFFERNPESPDTQRWYEFLNNSHGCDQPLVQEFEIGDHYYQFYSVCYADHNYMNVYGFDITLLKETQHALTESEVRFRSMVENASDIIYRASVDGIFTYVNVTAETITGYSTDELLTMHFGQLIRPDQQEIVADFYAAQIREKIKSTYLEFPIYTKY